MQDISLSACNVCPRDCNANREDGPLGYCHADAGLNVASMFIHHGEEPLISGQYGICNVFFRHCNLRCIFCQNHQISSPNALEHSSFNHIDKIVSYVKIAQLQGCRGLGFVSPSHMIPQMKMIHDAVLEQGFKPVVVFNTNAYDRPEVIDDIADRVDVWLPDFKYMDSRLADRWSDAPDYPLIALEAIKAMYRHSGSTIVVEDDIAVSGMIIRHLVLPGQVGNSIKVLETIADHVGTDVCISLMSQYQPNIHARNHPDLGRNIYAREYAMVIDRLEGLGFYKGWVQDLGSSSIYLPDFDKDRPFD